VTRKELLKCPEKKNVGRRAAGNSGREAGVRPKKVCAETNLELGKNNEMRRGRERENAEKE